MPAEVPAGAAPLSAAPACARSGARLGAAPIRTPHTSQKSSLADA
jgi:hypothetical protein